jgi:hypothetical protein
MMLISENSFACIRYRFADVSHNDQRQVNNTAILHGKERSGTSQAAQSHFWNGNVHELIQPRGPFAEWDTSSDRRACASVCFPRLAKNTLPKDDISRESYGIRAFDTSPYYGSSEIILGNALMSLKSQFPRSSYQLVKIALRYYLGSVASPGAYNDLCCNSDDEMRTLRTRSVVVRLLPRQDSGECGPEPGQIADRVFGHGVPT